MLPPDAPVFIVDDDPAMRAALSRLFRLAVLAAQSFGGAREILDRAPDLGAGCLSLDHGLPDLSGLELRAELARAGMGLPIIFLTAHGSRSLRAKALQAGALGFLKKPVQARSVANR